MAFIVKNPHPAKVTVGTVSFDPGQQLRIVNINPEIADALDRGDIVIVGNDENDPKKDPPIHLDTSDPEGV